MSTPTPTALAQFQSLNLLERLRQNDLPTNSDRNDFAALFHLGQLDRRAYEGTIVRLEAELCAARRDHNELLKCMQAMSSLSAPIRRLPPEILLEIFSSVCEDGNQIEREGDITIPAISLVKVSKQWHNLVSGTPRFWSTISLTCPGGLTASMQRVFDGLLTMSGDAPLSLSIGTWGEIEQQDDLFAQVCSVAHRWSILDIMELGDATFPWESLSSELPHLESLSLSCDHYGPKIFNHLAGASNLRNVEFWIDGEDGDENDDPAVDLGSIPHPGVRSLYIRFYECHPTMFRNLVSLLPSLYKATIGFQNLRTNFQSLSTPFVVPRLRELVILVMAVMDSQGTFDLFLPLISTPALSHLTLDCNDFGGTIREQMVTPGLLNFLSRTSSLRSLTIEGFWRGATTEDILTLLRACPGLAKLELSEVTQYNIDSRRHFYSNQVDPWPANSKTILSTTFFSALSERKPALARAETSSFSISPKLETLILGARSEGFDSECFVAAVRARFHPQVPGSSDTRFQCVDLDITGGIFSRSSYDELLEMRRSGLRVHVSDETGDLGLITMCVIVD